MFFCPPCRIKNDWPESLVRSHGTCEICGAIATCYDVPSHHLPLQLTAPTSPALTVTHRIHVISGLEYQGETYIWCECLAGNKNLAQVYHGRGIPDSALFDGKGATELLAWLSRHTPGASVEEVTVTSLYVNCSFPKHDDVKAASDTCQRPADSAVEMSNGDLHYRCPVHRGRINQNQRGNVVFVVPRAVPVPKITGT